MADPQLPAVGTSYAVLQRSWADPKAVIFSVERETRTQIVCRIGTNEVRYRKDTGRLVGGHSSVPPPITGEQLLEVRRVQAARVMRDFDTRNVSAEWLDQLDELLKNPTA